MVRQKKRKSDSKINRKTEGEEENFKYPITMDELKTAISDMKRKTAAGVDGIWTEEIKSFVPTTKRWILAMLNNCIDMEKVPKIWLKAKVVALLKPGKNE